MKAHVKPGWQLSEEGRANLRNLLAAVDAGAAEDAPEFLRLLDFWESCEPPWDLTPTVMAVRVRTGDAARGWLIHDVRSVLATISRHLEGA